VHWVRVDGYPLPKLVGGHPALEFCNTWSGWAATPWRADAAPDPKREWLPTYDRFVVWTGHAGLLPADEVRRLRAVGAESPAPAGAVLARAHRLRLALYRLLTGDGSAFAAVAGELDPAARAAVLTPSFTRELPDGLGVTLALLATARAAEDLLTGPLRPVVHACPGEDCGWLFADARGRRRWCDMSSCGNRAKVRAHAARTRGV
jgi:predicted RNA-binding Zn ribbon-like protein